MARQNERGNFPGDNKEDFYEKVFQKSYSRDYGCGNIFSCALTASAYSDSGSWNFYINPHASNTSKEFYLNYYSGGYRAVITSKGYGGSSNSVTITENGTQRVFLTEQGVPCQIFKANFINIQNGESFAVFKAKFDVETVTEQTAYNKGDIKLSNMF